MRPSQTLTHKDHSKLPARRTTPPARGERVDVGAAPAAKPAGGPIERLPSETKARILGHLSLQPQARMGRVNRQWQALTQQPTLALRAEEVVYLAERYMDCKQDLGRHQADFRRAYARQVKYSSIQLAGTRTAELLSRLQTRVRVAPNERLGSLWGAELFANGPRVNDDDDSSPWLSLAENFACERLDRIAKVCRRELVRKKKMAQHFSLAATIGLGNLCAGGMFDCIQGFLGSEAPWRHPISGPSPLTPQVPYGQLACIVFSSHVRQIERYLRTISLFSLDQLQQLAAAVPNAADAYEHLDSLSSVRGDLCDSVRRQLLLPPGRTTPFIAGSEDQIAALVINELSPAEKQLSQKMLTLPLTAALLRFSDCLLISKLGRTRAIVEDHGVLNARYSGMQYLRATFTFAASTRVLLQGGGEEKLAPPITDEVKILWQRQQDTLALQRKQRSQARLTYEVLGDRHCFERMRQVLARARDCALLCALALENGYLPDFDWRLADEQARQHQVSELSRQLPKHVPQLLRTIARTLPNLFAPGSQLPGVNGFSEPLSRRVERLRAADTQENNRLLAQPFRERRALQVLSAQELLFATFAGQLQVLSSMAAMSPAYLFLVCALVSLDQGSFICSIPLTVLAGCWGGMALARIRWGQAWRPHGYTLGRFYRLGLVSNILAIEPVSLAFAGEDFDGNLLISSSAYFAFVAMHLSAINS